MPQSIYRLDCNHYPPIKPSLRFKGLEVLIDYRFKDEQLLRKWNREKIEYRDRVSEECRATVRDALGKISKMDVKCRLNPFMTPGRINITEQYVFPFPVEMAEDTFEFVRRQRINPEISARDLSKLEVKTIGKSQNLGSFEVKLYRPWKILLNQLPEFFRVMPGDVWSPTAEKKYMQGGEYLNITDLIEKFGFEKETSQNWASLFLRWPEVVSRLNDMKPDVFARSRAQGMTACNTRRDSLIAKTKKLGYRHIGNLPDIWEQLAGSLSDAQFSPPDKLGRNEHARTGVKAKRLQKIVLSTVEQAERAPSIDWKSGNEKPSSMMALLFSQGSDMRFLPVNYAINRL